MEKYRTDLRRIARCLRAHVKTYKPGPPASSPRGDFGNLALLKIYSRHRLLTKPLLSRDHGVAHVFVKQACLFRSSQDLQLARSRQQRGRRQISDCSKSSPAARFNVGMCCSGAESVLQSSAPRDTARHTRVCFRSSHDARRVGNRASLETQAQKNLSRGYT